MLKANLIRLLPIITRWVRLLLIKGLYHLHSVKVIEANIVSDFLALKGSERICDIACGLGQPSIQMAKAGCSVYGVDIRERAIQNARLIGEKHKHNCSFCLASAEALPYKSNVFDKVVCICALEHFENDDAALKEMHRILKPGGVLVLTVDSLTYRGIKSSFREFHQRSAHVVNYYTDSQLAVKLQGVGFEVEESKYFINSPISTFFFNWGKRLEWGVPYLALFPIIYPLSILSDRFFGCKNQGYLLAMKARKRDRVIVGHKSIL
ncbi:class I SAM-dependent methyltransferase [Dehalococcoidales bacterium]|nr:class I SAM-dependent methyltransferase [Dehalococcoidales bacterium]